jgi:hypothetical protein
VTEPRPIHFPALRDPSEWPAARCPHCGHERPHPIGGEQPCDTCREDADELARAEAARITSGSHERRAILPALLSRAGCPTRYRNFTRQSWEQTYGPWGKGPVTAKLDGWTGEEPDSWLVLLYGRYGVRKTSLATALLGERIVAGKRARWWDAAEFAQAMQAGIRDNSAMDVYEQLASAEVLLLDDLGSVIGGREGRRAEQNWWAEQCALLLRHRESWVKPTIVTANIESVSELERVDASLVSRCDVKLAFKLVGKNYRNEA